ncbi:hypothetical protein [Ferrimonas balearica]|uniref:hypothetical protein n=1 Tax=Ferrimonas balearica TaxID=44012 RepID=UPI001F31D179|nr:hypothetical protein [Ferrimonas balearica]MBY6093820.1 hypothetical protein [Ferrimonas balearica]
MIMLAFILRLTFGSIAGFNGWAALTASASAAGVDDGSGSLSFLALAVLSFGAAYWLIFGGEYRGD